MPIQVISPSQLFILSRINSISLLLNFLLMFVTFIVISNYMVYDLIDFFNFLNKHFHPLIIMLAFIYFIIIAQ
ncbi:Uncharacterised protein [Klebsiella pneumoniae]|nr:Uncharacterised protein [Klebsiella pneumoniae]